jgi:ribosomal protein S16
MNKFYNILIAVMIMGGAVNLTQARSAVDNLNKFRSMEGEHLIEWIELMKKKHAKKAEIIEDGIRQWVNFGNKTTEQVANLKGEQQVDAKLESTLDDAIELHKKHKGVWKEFGMKFQQEVKDLVEKHDKQLKAFEKSLKPQKEESEEEEAPEEEEEVEVEEIEVE